MLDTVLRAGHVLAVIVYLGGGLFLHTSFRRGVRLIPPGQAAILGGEVGRHFTWISWGSLLVWGITGNWMLSRFGFFDVSSPVTLFVSPDLLSSAYGIKLFVMIASWYVLVASASVITFLLRPRLTPSLAPSADTAALDSAVARAEFAAVWIDRLALVNLVLATVGFLAGAFLR